MSTCSHSGQCNEPIRICASHRWTDRHAGEGFPQSYEDIASPKQKLPGSIIPSFLQALGKSHENIAIKLQGLATENMNESCDFGLILTTLPFCLEKHKCHLCHELGCGHSITKLSASVQRACTEQHSAVYTPQHRDVHFRIPIKTH